MNRMLLGLALLAAVAGFSTASCTNSNENIADDAGSKEASTIADCGSVKPCVLGSAKLGSCCVP
jgi:hypothetical protein